MINLHFGVGRCFLRADLTQALAVFSAAHQRIMGHLVVLGPLGVAVVWRRRSQIGSDVTGASCWSQEAIARRLAHLESDPGPR